MLVESDRMIEEILPNLYRIEVPLPRSPLKALNSYIIKGNDRFLIIDTAFNREECWQPTISALRELDVDLTKTDFFITHLHADHSGLVGRLATPTSKVYYSEVEASIIGGGIGEGEAHGHWRDMEQYYSANGFPAEELSIALQGHPGRRYSSRQSIKINAVRDGESIKIGDYKFKGVLTAGHTPGHMCLYEPEKKVLIAGDHLLIDITPNITTWLELENSLKSYLQNLEKVYALDVGLVLPGHRRLWNDHRKRIRELQEHHRNRLAEAVAALESGPKTAWEVAPYITWDIEADSWEDFPTVQKFFAVGETLAHLNYLEGEGKVRRETRNGKIFYSLI
jgi:glyoxylase-like metal-dependent hydrolase (beta-lactamase superfamily II)